MSDRPGGPPIPDVVAQHFDELAFLGVQRRVLLFAPEVPLVDYWPHEERIAAHWDGLWVAGPFAVEMAEERLEAFDPWDVAVAASVWMALGTPTAEMLRERWDGLDAESRGPWRHALAALPAERIEALVGSDWQAWDGPAVDMLTYGLGWSGRLAPESVPFLVGHDDPGVRRSVARVLGWSQGGVPPAAGVLRPLFDDPDPTVRDVALWSAALINPDGAAAWARKLVVGSGDVTPFTLRVLGLLGTPADVDLLAQRAQDPALAAPALQALGDTCSPLAVQHIVRAVAEHGDAWVPAGVDALEKLLGPVEDLREVIPDAEPEAAPVGDEESLPGVGAESPRAAAPRPGAMAAEFRLTAEGVWAERQIDFPVQGRFSRGAPIPWSRDPGMEPMEFAWRRLVGAPDPDGEWLRREVPPGFFSGLPAVEVLPGETT